MEAPNENSIFDELEQSKPIDYATTGQRFANYIVDLIVVYGLLFCLSYVLGMLSAAMGVGFVDFLLDESGLNPLFRWFYIIIVFIVMYTLMEGVTKGRSLGKLITKTKAVTEDGGVISWKQAFLRSCSRMVPFEAFSGFGGHPWHDSWTKTIVVKINP